jgi:hypothetical protein
VFAVHGCPSAQRAHEPPQSMPVSVPFLIPSVHETQEPLKQVPLLQSASATHALPREQPTAQTPPQSTSVSDTFLTPS